MKAVLLLTTEYSGLQTMDFVGMFHSVEEAQEHVDREYGDLSPSNHAYLTDPLGGPGIRATAVYRTKTIGSKDGDTGYLLAVYE